MRLFADMHISPRTVRFLRALDYDVVRVDEALPAGSSDHAIVAYARTEGRAILTQDLDFCAIVRLAGLTTPTVISLRLASSRIEHVNERLRRVLPAIKEEIAAGMLLTVEDEKVRCRLLTTG